MNPTVAAMLSIGLDSRGFRAHPNNMEEAWQDFNVSYFAIYPAFRFSAFTIGHRSCALSRTQSHIVEREISMP